MRYSWREFKLKNSWEHITYWVDDEEFKPDTHGDSEYFFKWPNGKVTRNRVYRRGETRKYTDHGHRGQVYSYRYFIRKRVHGLLVEVPVEQLRIRCNNEPV